MRGRGLAIGDVERRGALGGEIGDDVGARHLARHGAALIDRIGQHEHILGREPRGKARDQLAPHHLERPVAVRLEQDQQPRSEEHTSELQSLMRISYAVFCLKKKKKENNKDKMITTETM